MRMNDLVRYDIPPEIIQLWKARESTHLLPLQEAAVERHGALGDGNMLIQAPTSSGKTFVGEMAAVKTALRRKKAIYLVPLKALAEEKYQNFSAKYSSYGIKVVISSRDHREWDRDLEAGDFSIAIVVYEKLAQLLVRRPAHIEEIELVIADELEILSDAERGASIEILLTRIVRSSCRLIGLSAVVGEAERLAEWMQAKLVAHERRPVELRFGVLYEGCFHYRTYNDCAEGMEEWSDPCGETPWETLTQHVAEMSGRGETCLIFVKSKYEARSGAEFLSGRLELPTASNARDSLDAMEQTGTRDRLLHTLNSGVAFHSADLAPEERRAVENGFRNGEVRVLVCTSTLAVGLNLPAQNVFISADKWRYDERFGMPWKTPILRSEFENMGGRAGRYGVEQDFGRSILIANSAFDKDALWRRYVKGEREAIQPRLDRAPLENQILYLVASGTCRDEDEILEFLESTLTGRWIWQEIYTLAEIEHRIRVALHRAIDAGVLAISLDEELVVTPLGRAVAAKGISIQTAAEMEAWVRVSANRDWCVLDPLLMTALTPDGRNYSVALTNEEYEHSGYLEAIRQSTAGESPDVDVPLNRIRCASQQGSFEEMRAVKIALLLSEWIEQEATLDIEDRYRTTVGQILGASAQLSWLLDATAAVAQAQGVNTDLIERLRVLAERVQFGVWNDALPLARIREPKLQRSTMAAMVSHQLVSPESIVTATASELCRLMPEEHVTTLKAWASGLAVVQERRTDSRSASCEATGEHFVLVVDDSHPDCIVLDGTSIPLQDKQYRLIRLLAEAPGQCISYDTVYKALWGDAVVEAAQLHFQKNRLLNRIRKLVPNRSRILRTIPKRGFVLQLEPGEAVVRKRSPRSFAETVSA